MMFRKRDRIETLEAVLDALISLLHKRGIVRQDEIQLEILDRAHHKGDNIFGKQLDDG